MKTKKTNSLTRVPCYLSRACCQVRAGFKSLNARYMLEGLFLLPLEKTLNPPSVYLRNGLSGSTNQAALACLLLSLSLVFSGCLSFDDDTSMGDLNNPGNNAPLVTADTIFFHPLDYTMFSNQGIYVKWSAIDVDGTISSAGFDIDLDMIIDVPVSKDSGTYIDNSTNTAYPGALSIPLDQGWTSDRFVYEPYTEFGFSPCSLMIHRTFAFIAEDNDGAASAELVQFHRMFNLETYTANNMDNDAIGRLDVSQADIDWLMSAECSSGVVEPPGSPFAQLSSTVASNGEYYVTVITVSDSHDLEDFSYFLKDASGSTNEFGEIAMQNLSGNVVGIDASYGDKCGGDTQSACETDMSTRADAVENDSGSNYAVAFYDNDRDGKLSAGDKFTVRGSHGSGADGPAEDDWSLEIHDGGGIRTFITLVSI